MSEVIYAPSARTVWRSVPNLLPDGVPSTHCTGVSQAWPTSAKGGKGLVNCVYKLCTAALYSVVQSHCSILSHDALRHCLSSNRSLENGERELGHRFHYYRSCKNTSTILLRVRAYSTTGKTWFRHPAYCIPVGHSLYTQFTRLFPSFAEVGQVCKTNCTVWLFGNSLVPRPCPKFGLGLRLLCGHNFKNDRDFLSPSIIQE